MNAYWNFIAVAHCPHDAAHGELGEANLGLVSAQPKSSAGTARRSRAAAPPPRAEGVPAPADRAPRRDADLDHITRLGSGHLHQTQHRVRAVQVTMPQRLRSAKLMPNFDSLPQCVQVFGVADRVPGRNCRRRLGGRSR